MHAVKLKNAGKDNTDDMQDLGEFAGGDVQSQFVKYYCYLF